MKQIYIAGAITGLPTDQVKAKFEAKQLELVDLTGYIVVSPPEFIQELEMENEPWDKIMKVCIVALMQCEELHLLPCWNQSKGAALERDIALRIGMPIVYH